MLGKVELKEKNPKKAFSYFSKAVELDADLLDAQVELGNIFLMARQFEEARSKCYYVLDKQPDHQLGRLLEAGVLLAEKKLQPARDRLENLKSEGLNDPQLYLMLASIQLGEGDKAGGRDILLNGITANPDNIRLRAVLTALLLDEKSYDEAIAQVKEAIRIEPQNKVHKLKLAAVYWDADRKDDVQSLFRQMIAEDDKPADVRIMVADFYSKHKKMDKALAVINDGIEKEPQNTKLRLALSVLQIDMRDHDGAIDTLKAALTMTKDNADPDVLKVKNQLAKIYLGIGEIEAAKKYSDEIIGISAGDVDAQFTAGQIYLHEKDGIKAVSAFRTVVSERPELLSGYLYLAQSHLLNNEKQLAIDALTNGLAVNKKAAGLRKALARIYTADKDFESAEKQLRLIIEQNPQDIRSRADLADFLFLRQKPDEAIAIYDEMITQYPEVPAGYLKLAAILRSREKPEEAVAVMEKGYQTIPQSPPILTELVKSYISLEDYGKAIGVLGERLKSNEKDFLANNLLGETYLTRKEYDKAKHYFEKAIALTPEWQIPHNNLARLYLYQGQTAEAIKNLTSALDKNPKNAAAYMTLGNLYSASGQGEKVIGVYEKALAAMPELWPAANNLAYLLAGENAGQADLERARELALKAVAMQPDRPDVIDTLGWVHYQRGEIDLAITELEKAVSMAPDSATINYHLGLALIRANRRNEARQALEKALNQEEFTDREAAEKALSELGA
jgi:tetratricopeptide (TPR) repeat protein